MFYWRVVNPRGGITHDWYFTFREVHIRPLAPTSLEDLLVWLDYQQPGNVELSLVDRQPDPRYQVINYDWF